jgi:ABC-type sugar transport system substrate-binding protein
MRAVSRRTPRRTKINRLGAVVLFSCLTLPAAGFAQSVVFIDPGKSDEIYWVTAAHAMQAAARSLGMQLSVRYAERDHPRSMDIAREIAALPPRERPQFAIVTNDYATGPELLRILDSAGIKTLFAYSRILAAPELADAGRPRGRYKGWLGSIEPRAGDAGYMTANALIARARAAHAFSADGKLHMLAIGGDRSSTTSILRDEGMRRAVAEHADVVLEQEVIAGWTRDKAAEQSAGLYERYPDAHLIWAGNDLMAFGAMQSWEQRGGTPGKDAFFSGINTSQEALADIRNGRLAALAGGHFICGAWALVLLYDYAHGRDFADEGLELERPMFMLFTPKDARRFEQRYGGTNFDNIDFRRYSKVLNPKLRQYDFDFRQLMR